MKPPRLPRPLHRRRAALSCRKPARAPSTALRLRLPWPPRLLPVHPALQAASSAGVPFSIAVLLAAQVASVPALVVPEAQAAPVDRSSPACAAPCTPHVRRPVALPAPVSVPAWVRVPASDSALASAPVPAWVALLRCRLRAKRRVQRVPAPVAAAVRTTKRPKKAP